MDQNPNGTATSYRSITLSPKGLLFSMTIQAGLSLPIEKGEKPEDALVRVDEIVKASVLAKLDEAMQFEVQDPRVQGQGEAYRAAKEGRPSTQEVLKEAQGAAPAVSEAPVAGTPARRTPPPARRVPA